MNRLPSAFRGVPGQRWERDLEEDTEELWDPILKDQGDGDIISGLIQNVLKIAVNIPVVDDLNFFDRFSTVRDEAARMTAQHEKAPSVSLKALKDAIPEHCFKSSLLTSSLYLARDIAYAAALVYCALKIPSLESVWLRGIAWTLYGFAQGCVGTGLWIMGHECGHGAYSDYPLINDIIGWAVHSSLLVPYFSWQITHARHHRYTGHMEKDTAFVPSTEAEYRAKHNLQHNDLKELAEDTPIMGLINLLAHQLGGWQLYLLAYVTSGPDSTPEKSKAGSGTRSHFDPFGKLFTRDQRVKVALSTLGVTIMASILFYLSTIIGKFEIFCLYIIPNLWVHHWLVAITYLHHTHPSVAHFSPDEWTFVKGSISTVDRSFGFIGRHFFHEIIDFHVVHHVFSRIPFYNAEEATKAIRPLLGDSYIEQKDENFLKSLYTTFTTCLYVTEIHDSDLGNVFRWASKKAD
ncbi:hypothetical protein FQN52_000861 [Onygenales sp. PD_12]|nr:hypothetical protein FQN52_000861 [Onygenales sp. PD_12]